MEGLYLRPNNDQLFRVRIRQGCEQGCVVYGKDGGIRANAQSQREKNGKRKPRALPQRTEAKTKVTQQIRHWSTSCLWANQH